MTLAYSKNKVLDIPLSDKILLNLKHDESSQKISNQPFALFFDDVRSLHFAYTVDFSSDAGAVANFERISSILLERQFWLKTTFEKMIGEGEEKVIFLQDPNIIVNFIKEQIEYFYPNLESTPEKPVLYNPTVFIPFVGQAERKAVIDFCHSHLVNIVIYDFLHHDVQQTEEKKLFKTIKKTNVVAKEKKFSLEDTWWNRIHTENLLDLGTHVVINEAGKILKTSFTESESFSKAALTLKPYFEGYKWFSSPLELRADLDKNMDFIKLYFAVMDTLCPLESLMKAGYQISSKNLLSLVTYLRTQHRVKSFNISQANLFSSYLVKQWGNKDEVYEFYNTILEKEASISFKTSDCFLISDNVTIVEFVESSLKLKKNYPRVFKELRDWFEPQVVSETEAGRLLVRFLRTGTVEQIQKLLEIYPRLPIYATNIVKNSQFLDIVRVVTPEKVISISKVFHLLHFADFKKLMEIPHNGAPLRTYYRNEIGSLLNARSSLSSEDVEYILQYGPEVIEADAFAVNTAFSGYAQNDSIIKKLEELRDNPRLKISRQAWEFIRLKLYKRGIPDIFKTLNLSYA